MAMVTFNAEGISRDGYLALPEGGRGRGVLVLHAWWGLIDFFKSTCDRLAAEGFVAFAPDVHHGRTASTVEEAEYILKTRDSLAAQATAEAALHFFQAHPAVQGDRLSAVGFSMGAAFALLLDSSYPDAFDKIVLFYGMAGADLARSKARFQCHFGETDDWEPLEDVKQMNAANAEIYIYPGAYHWFFESDRPEHFDPEAAALVWKRTLEFLRA